MRQRPHLDGECCRSAVHRRALAEPIRFRLERAVLYYRHAIARRPHAALTLLDDMGEFMPDQLLALHAVRLIAPGGEIQVVTRGEGDRPDPRRLRADMHTYRGEVRPERRFHLGEQRLR